MRTIAYIDGFNLYHAFQRHAQNDPKQNYVKWVNLRTLAGIFAPPSHYSLIDVYYFSAYATWKPGQYKRHREYVKALRAVGVTPILGQFKEKDRFCFKCTANWKAHEEKETDINIAIHMLMDACDDKYDAALLISSDSDFCPAVRMIKARFPKKTIRVITPNNLARSMDLVNAVGGPKFHSEIKRTHIVRSLLPKEVRDSSGKLCAVRPTEYDPPT